MATNLLMNISKDERERAIFRSRRKFQMDHASDIATAEDRGERTRAFDIARNLLNFGDPIDKIVTVTGLTREEVENLRINT